MLQSAVLFFFGHISLYVFGEAYGGVLDAYAELDISERRQKHFNLYLLQLRVSDFCCLPDGEKSETLICIKQRLKCFCFCFCFLADIFLWKERKKGISWLVMSIGRDHSLIPPIIAHTSSLK